MIGTKGVARDMKKICSGTRRDEGTKWFTELADKGTHDKHVTKKTKKNSIMIIIINGIIYIICLSQGHKNTLLLGHAKQQWYRSWISTIFVKYCGSLPGKLHIPLLVVYITIIIPFLVNSTYTVCISREMFRA